MAKITVVSRNFPPLTGGMERLVYELYQTLIHNHEVALLGPEGCEEYADSNTVVRSTAISPTPLFLLLTLFKGLKLHRLNGRSDLIIGGSGLVGPVVILLAKFCGARTILLLHGLDIIADSQLYQWLFVPFLRRADLVICNSQNTARLAVAGGVNEQNVAIVNPGAETQQNPVSHQEAKRSLNFENKSILLSVGRLIPRKGLPEFIEKSFTRLAAKDPNLVLLIAGVEPSSALNKSGASVLARIEAAVSKYNLSEQVVLLGHVSDSEISTLYAAADVFVFPLIETHGDVEGFGMVAVEAASHGTPTVAFDCGGVSDAVVDGENGILVAPDDYEVFSTVTLQLLRGDSYSSSRDKAREFSRQFSWESYGAQAQGCIERVLI